MTILVIKNCLLIENSNSLCTLNWKDSIIMSLTTKKNVFFAVPQKWEKWVGGILNLKSVTYCLYPLSNQLRYSNSAK